MNMLTCTIYTIYGEVTVRSSAGACLAEAQRIWDALATLHGEGAMRSARP